MKKNIIILMSLVCACLALAVVVSAQGIREDPDCGNACEEAIKAELPEGVIRSNQQIYVVDMNGRHHLGTFDKVVTSDDQMWAFNYVAGNEKKLSMPSLLRVLNVWERESLSYEEIVDQVRAFINSTIY